MKDSLIGLYSQWNMFVQTGFPSINIERYDSAIRMALSNAMEPDILSTDMK